MITYQTAHRLRKGMLVKCINSEGYPHLTLGKIYTTDSGEIEGIFATCPYVAVIGDTNKRHICHTTRFEFVQEN